MNRLSAVRDLTHKQPTGGGGMDHRILMLCGHKPVSKAGAAHWNGIWLRCGACQAERSAQKAKPTPVAPGAGFYHHEEGAK